MGALMSERWANLAKHGNPNGGAAEAGAASGPWVPYSAAADEAFVFGDTAASSAMRPNKRAQCDFLRWCRGNERGHASIGAPGQPGQLCTPNA
jgi:hypothetical protein